MSVEWRLRRTAFRFGVRLLKWSGWCDGYYNHWRGEAFDYAQARGLHILPVHYYSPVPDTRRLTGPPPDARLVLGAGDLDAERGAVLVENMGARFGREFVELATKAPRGPHDYDAANSAYGPFDAFTLYAMIRDARPARMVEIGSGHSTLAAAAAVRRNLADDPGKACDYICIEPYPPDFLRPPPPEVGKIIDKPLQDAPLVLFDNLGHGDILFIDSTHVVNFASDVVREILAILPRLASGVLIHIHDVFLPDEYPQTWIHSGRFFWNEQYLLRAFLLFNDEFEVLLPSQFVFRSHAARLRAALGGAFEFDDLGPTAFWLRRK